MLPSYINARFGAEGGNRTHIPCLQGKCSTIELPRLLKSGGRWRNRTPCFHQDTHSFQDCFATERRHLPRMAESGGLDPHPFWGNRFSKPFLSPDKFTFHKTTSTQYRLSWSRNESEDRSFIRKKSPPDYASLRGAAGQ